LTKGSSQREMADGSSLWSSVMNHGSPKSQTKEKMVRGRSLPCSGARQRAKYDGGSSGRGNPSSTDELGF
jgi:hypothetical protein